MSAPQIRSRLFRAKPNLRSTHQCHRSRRRASYTIGSHSAESGSSEGTPLDHTEGGKPSKSTETAQGERSGSAPSRPNNTSFKTLDLRNLGSAGATEARKPIIKRVVRDFPSSRPASSTDLLDDELGNQSRQRGPRKRTDRNDQGGSRRRRQPVRRDEDDEEDGEDEITEALRAYNTQKEAQKFQTKDYEPSDITIEHLRPYAPKVPIGLEGARTILRSRMIDRTDPFSTVDETRVNDLATRLRDDKYVYFRTEKEKAAVAEAAKIKEDKYAARKSKKTGEKIEPRILDMEPLSKKSRAVLEGELFEGKYKLVQEGMRNKTVDSIIHLVRKNNSYHNEDEAKLLAKLGSLLPASRPAKQVTAPK